MMIWMIIKIRWFEASVIEEQKDDQPLRRASPEIALIALISIKMTIFSIKMTIFSIKALLNSLFGYLVNLMSTIVYTVNEKRHRLLRWDISVSCETHLMRHMRHIWRSLWHKCHSWINDDFLACFSCDILSSLAIIS